MSRKDASFGIAPSVDSEEKKDNAGSRLRRVAQDLLTQEDRTTFRDALRKYREDNLLGKFITQLSHVVTSYDRLPIINAVAAMFPEAATVKDTCTREEFLDKVAEAIPLFASTRKLSKAAASSTSRLMKVRSISVVAASSQGNTKGRSSPGSLPSAKGAPGQPMTRARSIGNLDESACDDDREREWASPEPPSKQRYQSRYEKRRAAKERGAHDDDPDSLAISQRVQEERQKERPPLSSLADKGFWSPDDSLSSESESYPRSRDSSRRPAGGLYEKHRSESWKTSSHNTLLQDSASTDQSLDRRKKLSLNYVSSNFASDGLGNVELKEEYINIPFDEVQPLIVGSYTLLKAFISIYPNMHLQLTGSVRRPRCLLRSMSTKRDLIVLRQDHEESGEKLITRAVQVTPITRSVAVQTVGH